jgi:hypothetical protein
MTAFQLLKHLSMMSLTFIKVTVNIAYSLFHYPVRPRREETMGKLIK